MERLLSIPNRDVKPLGSKILDKIVGKDRLSPQGRGKMKKALKILFLATFLILILNFISPKVRGFFYFIFSPIENFFWQISTLSISKFKFLSQLEENKKRLEFLEKERLKLLAENLSLKELKRENEFLKRALELKKTQNKNFIFAKVFQKDFFSDSILVDKGILDGIKNGDYVFSPENVFLGKVTESFDHFSRVTLVTKKDFEIDLKVVEKEIFGKGKGKGNQKLTAQFLEGKEKIEVGDKIITAGLFSFLPENLLIGEITKKQQRETSPYLEVEIQPYFSLSNLEFVLISRK